MKCLKVFKIVQFSIGQVAIKCIRCIVFVHRSIIILLLCVCIVLSRTLWGCLYNSYNLHVYDKTRIVDRGNIVYTYINALIVFIVFTVETFPFGCLLRIINISRKYTGYYSWDHFVYLKKFLNEHPSCTFLSKLR